MYRFFRWAVPSIAALCLFFLVQPLTAQVNISGTVVDPDGAAVPNVEILLKKSSAGDASAVKTTSDATGHFVLRHVSASPYQLEVPAKWGFDLYVSTVQVSAAMHDLHIQLVPSTVNQDVSVESSSDQLAPDASANRDQIVTDAKMLENVPVFDQDYIGLLSSFLDSNGTATSGVSIVVDGIEMKGTGVSASAIAEAHINRDPYSAETNRPGKGQIEIITKPGSPSLNGTLNFTFRDSLFDAKNYFAATRPFEQKRIYEGSITGPLGNDKTTFLLSGSRQEDNLAAIVHAITLSGVVNENVPAPIHTTDFAARIAHDFSAAHRVSFQYNVTDAISRNAGTGSLVLPEAGSNAQAREDDVIFNDRVVVSPTLLNQFQLFFEKDYNPTRSAVQAQKTIIDGAFTSGGAQADLLNTENNLKINDIVSWSHHRHYVKFGINIPNLSRRAWEDHTNRLGTYSFASLAAYQSGTPYSFTQQLGPGRTTFWMNEIGSFIQDQMQVRPDLQVSFGLRYDWQTYFKSVHDFAPRLSFAYSPGSRKTVIRAGIGIFYDRSGSQPMADLRRYNGSTIRAITLLNPSYPSPYPATLDPATLPTNLVQEAPGARLPYITNFSTGAEQRIAKSIVFAATYRGTIGIALFRSRDVNAPLPPFYTARPNPQFGVIRQIESEGRQIGNALDLTLNFDSNPWFSGLVQYTFSHTNNNTGGITWFPANQYALGGEYGRSDFDQRQRLNVLGTIHADHWLNLGIALHAYSGLPYTETSGEDTYNTGLLNARPAGVSRNTLQGAGNTQLDLRWSHELFSFHKSAKESRSFTFAIDAFNVTNHVNDQSYVGNVQSLFFAQPTAALPGRRIQFTGRIRF